MTTTEPELTLSALTLPEQIAEAQKLAPPRMLHHTAYVTHDTVATVDFYTRVLRMKQVATVIDDAVPSTGDPFPYIHLFSSCRTARRSRSSSRSICRPRRPRPTRRMRSSTPHPGRRQQGRRRRLGRAPA